MKWIKPAALVIVLVLGGCTKSQLPVTEKKVGCNDPKSLYVISGNLSEDLPCLIPQTQRKALVTYLTSTDCTACGVWGTEFFNNILNENASKAEGLIIHVEGTDPWIISDLKDSALSCFQPKYIPYIMIEDEVPAGRDYPVIDPNIILPRAKTWIENISSEVPEIAPALVLEIAEGKARIHYGGEYLKDCEGEYYFGLYLLEDHLEANQAGSKMQPYYHNNVVRQAIGGPWGIEIPSGDHEAADIFLGQVESDLIASWKVKDLHLLGVIWKKDEDGKMEVVNTIRAN
ncbi:MAG: Omp28-related outer membrane protein [Bacteroidetes bacterium]|nr:Omp28-related outer membrane protein [Bacteroidota bacterium]